MAQPIFRGFEHSTEEFPRNCALDTPSCGLGTLGKVERHLCVRELDGSALSLSLALSLMLNFLGPSCPLPGSPDTSVSYLKRAGFRFLSVGQKIALGYGIALGVAVIGNSLMFGLSYRLRIQSAQTVSRIESIVYNLNQWQRQLFILQAHQQQLLEVSHTSSRLQGELLRIQPLLLGLNQNVTQYQQQLTSDQARGTIPQSLRTALEERLQDAAISQTYSKTLELQLVRLRDLAKDPDEFHSIRNDVLAFNDTPASQQIHSIYPHLMGAVTLAEMELQHSRQRIRQFEAWLTWMNVATLLLSLGIALAVAYRIHATIATPLKFLTLTAQRATQQEDFDLQIPILEQDEMGILADVINRLLSRVQGLLREHEYTNQLLRSRNQEFEDMLRSLNQVQEQLIGSEKMSALGQLAAGIAHEINTPLGVAQSASGNISTALEHVLQMLPQIYKTLSEERLQDFMMLLDWVKIPKQPLSFRQERQLRKTLTQQLIALGIKHPDVLADNLSKMNISQDLNPILKLLQMPEAVFITEVAYQLTMLESNSKNIYTAIDRAAKIVVALKHYMHNDAIDAKVPTQVTDGIETVLTLYHNQIKRGVEVQRFYDLVPPILGHPDALIQVWSNLVGNALQAIGDQGTLTIKVTQRGYEVLVSITDTGPGVPLDLQERIFEPFFTTKPRGIGSGMGLSIVSKIIAKHNGKIMLVSEPGSTTFTVALSLLNETKNEQEAEDDFMLLTPPLNQVLVAPGSIA
jgi:signal transduction histidine kinase